MNSPAQAVSTASEPKAASYPQFNADGTPQLNDDGTPVMGATKAKRVRVKAATAPKAQKAVKPVVYELNEDGSQKLDEAGNPIPIKKAVKAPKVIQYQLDADGNQILDEAGNPIPVTKAPRQPKLDADGNPIPRASNVYLDSQIILRTELADKFAPRADSKRGQMFAAATNGLTVGEFYAATGGKAVSHTFLIWFVNEAKVLEIGVATDAPAATTE